MKNYRVSTRDVDGGDTRTYMKFDSARARFEEMVGFTMELAIDEQCCEDPHPPTARAIEWLRAVSHFGTVVTFQRYCDPEPEPVVAVEADPDPSDWDVPDDEPLPRYEPLSHPCDGDGIIPF